MFRITVDLKPLRAYGTLPFSYNQILASALHKKLSVHGSFHDRFKFSVSNLFFERFKIQDQRIFPEPNTRVKFIASFLTNIPFQEIYEALHEKELALGDDVSMIPFSVAQVVKQPDAALQSTMIFNSISPICVRLIRDDETHKYLLPGDEFFNDMFFDHAYLKHLDFTGERTDISKCVFKLLLKQGEKIKTKLVTIKAKNTELHIRGFMCPFSSTAPKAIQQTLVYAGAGQLNSSGFGCIEVRR